MFCRECMEPGQNVQALPCMHLFHAECLLGYAEVKGRPWSECCPYKCSVGLEAFEEPVRAAEHDAEDID